MKEKIKKEVPARQSIQYICERAENALVWLEELEKDFQKRIKEKKDCCVIQTQKRIIADIISVYISTLVDSRKNTNSLLTSYPKNDFVDKFKNLPIVKKCQMSRHNRCAHESKNYGFFVSPDEILKSNLKQCLSEIQFFIS
ncbi:MAG: hypothetical protein PHX25_02600 [Candidatus Pacebacteria bacterium]|nr:hypothetical protein [Candidatus Paceibacterota bacterium]